MTARGLYETQNAGVYRYLLIEPDVHYKPNLISLRLPDPVPIFDLDPVGWGAGTIAGPHADNLSLKPRGHLRVPAARFGPLGEGAWEGYAIDQEAGRTVT